MDVGVGPTSASIGATKIPGEPDWSCASSERIPQSVAVYLYIRTSPEVNQVRTRLVASTLSPITLLLEFALGVDEPMPRSGRKMIVVCAPRHSSGLHPDGHCCWITEMFSSHGVLYLYRA